MPSLQGFGPHALPVWETVADYAQSHASALARTAAASNRTGLPNRLKSGIETLSGIALDDVRVHRGSRQPAAIQAEAYTCGSEIHLAPGAEHHLAHEAWHVVQQKQGRVRPTLSIGGTPVNDDTGLEREADVMGARAIALPDHGTAASVAAPAAIATASVAQRVRRELDPQGKLTTLDNFFAACNTLLAQIDDLNLEPEELDAGFLMAGEVIEQREALEAALTPLRRIASPEDPATIAAIRNPTDDARRAQNTQMRKAIKIYAGLRTMLNDSFAALTRARTEQDEALRSQQARKPLSGTSTGGKWSEVKGGPSSSKTVTFHQYVPEDAATIQQALRSQRLSEAAYIKRKAMWVADPTRYKLSSANGKVRMEYTFTAEGAKSLMEEYLLCASGDFVDENPEPWRGEAQHPDYTLWKLNESGAYGIGERRRQQLDAHIVSIRAFDSKDREIKAKPAERNPPPAWAARLQVAGEHGVDQALVNSVVDFLDEHRYDPGRPVLVVNGSQWTCYIRCVLHAINRIGDYARVRLALDQAGVFVGSGVTIGTDQEDRVIAAITAVTGQQFHVAARDVAQGITEQSRHQVGMRVPLLLTGAHFNLLQ
ncbi:eCIS core domain-containing protein [Sphingomonas sp. DT-204]|uniref:eCIS core domain-containing protein n=1 Tax=Sphingomonas sp. DT-204 TaxID=3396166 RepID=UPI003F1A4BE5